MDVADFSDGSKFDALRLQRCINCFWSQEARKLFVFSVVGPAGFEPATSSTRTRRSTKLSHGPKYRMVFSVT